MRLCRRSMAAAPPQRRRAAPSHTRHHQRPSSTPQRLALGGRADQHDVGEEVAIFSTRRFACVPACERHTMQFAQCAKPAEEAFYPVRGLLILRASHAGSARERKAARGVAPIEARSLNPRARQRWPTAFGRMKVAPEVSALECKVGGDNDFITWRAGAESRNRRRCRA